MIVFVQALVHHKTDKEIDSLACESFTAETEVVLPAFTDDCGYGYNTRLNDGKHRIHALMMAGNVLTERSATVARQVYLISVRYQQRSMLSCNLPQLHFCLLKQLSSISTNFPPPFQQPR